MIKLVIKSRFLSLSVDGWMWMWCENKNKELSWIFWTKLPDCSLVLSKDLKLTFQKFKIFCIGYKAFSIFAIDLDPKPHVCVCVCITKLHGQIMQICYCPYECSHDVFQTIWHVWHYVIACFVACVTRYIVHWIKFKNASSKLPITC